MAPVEATHTPRNWSLRGAHIAQVVVAVAIAVRWGLGLTPEAWAIDDCLVHTPRLDGRAPLLGSLHRLVEQTPLADLGARYALWHAVAAAGLATLVCRTAYSLFRGPGRALASIVAGLLAGESLTALDGSDTDPTSALAAYLFTMVMLAGISAPVNALVHHGKVTGRAFTLATAAGLLLVVIDPRGGIPLGALLIALVLSRRFKSRRRSVSPIPWSAAGAITALAVVIALGARFERGAWDFLPGAWPTYDIDLEGINDAPLGFPPRLLWPSIALLWMLVLPLRWRGGLTMIIFTSVALWLRADGRWIAEGLPAACLASICAAGWIWLAGSVPKTPGRGLATACLGVIAMIVWGQPLVSWRDAASQARPAAHVHHLVAQGLAAPRDVALLHDDDLRAILRHHQQVHGYRPDLMVLDPRDMSDRELLERALSWASNSQRILSDSFSCAGRWDPAWAVESGPLYWFVFDAERAAQAPSMASRTNLDDLSLRDRLRLAPLLLERARFRHAVDRPELAARTLASIDASLGRLPRAVRAASDTKMPSKVRTQLDVARLPRHLTTWADIERHAATMAGDLLFHVGDLEGGERLLYTAAAQQQRTDAWLPLIAWWRASGRHQRVDSLITQMLEDPETRCLGVELAAANARYRRPQQGPVTDLDPRLIAMCPTWIELEARLAGL